MGKNAYNKENKRAIDLIPLRLWLNADAFFKWHIACRFRKS